MFKYFKKQNTQKTTGKSPRVVSVKSVSSPREFGFTLIEIVIVIGIMAVLTVIIYASFDTSRAKSRDQKRVSDISLIQLGLEQYFNKYSVYPLQLSSLVPTFIPEIPTDQTNTNNYNNQYFPIAKIPAPNSNSCVSYQLWAKFEKNNSYLNSKKSFDSTTLSLYHNLYECGNGHTAIQASSTANALVYDVMP